MGAWSNIYCGVESGSRQTIKSHSCVIKLHILEWPFIVASLRRTCAIIMLSNQHLDMPHLYATPHLGKGEVLTNTDLDRFVKNI